MAAGVEVAQALSRRASATTARSTRIARSPSASGWSTLLKPKWLRIGGYWYPRGGIPIDVFWQVGGLPKGVWVPDPGWRPIAGGLINNSSDHAAHSEIVAVARHAYIGIGAAGRPSVTRAVAVAVIRNPFAGRYVEDLTGLFEAAARSANK